MKKMNKTLALALLVPAAICTGCGNNGISTATAADAPGGGPGRGAGAAAAPSAPANVRVSLIAAAGNTVKGDLTLTNAGGAVAIRGQITGLAPGKEHGFHIHETGDCSAPDFTSAGGHYNPTMDPHGKPSSGSHHLGDIENLKADDKGNANIDVTVKGATIGDKDKGPGEILGKALVVHAMPDDYKTQPSGASGARIACGVIK